MTAMRLQDALKLAADNQTVAAEDKVSVALLCGFTPLHMQTFLTAELFARRPNHRIEVVTGEFANLLGSVEHLGHRHFDSVAVIIEWPDIDARLGTRQLGGWSPSMLPDIVAHSEAWLATMEAQLSHVSALSPVIVSLPTLPLPPLFFSPGWQQGACELRLKQCLANFAANLGKNPRVRFISEQALNLLSNVSERLDVRSDWLAGLPYRTTHAAALASLLARAIYNAHPMKGLITDLDNTLWSGIVGEDGPHNVWWDLDHNAQGHGLYQQFLSTLAEEGVLIAAVSKNDPTVIAEAFKREDLLLAGQKVFPFEVSWSSKAEAVSRVLNAWNVDADSVVFLDDDPLELAEVKAAHPRMKCIGFPARQPQAIYELVVDLRDRFGRLSVSPEDAIRRESLRVQRAVRESDTDGDGFSETLLERADGELLFEFEKNGGDPRPLDLINKTNQFNLNGRRFTESGWADYLNRHDTFVLTSTYKDKFGILGKIAVLAGRVESDDDLHLDAWVLSCRAFGRRIEHHCLQALFQKFKARNIRLAYSATERNTAMTRCLTELLDKTPSGEVVLTDSLFRARHPKLVHRMVHNA